jgi:transposase
MFRLFLVPPKARQYPRNIIAMAGLDPAVYQSGKHERKGRITKRGNRHLQRIIWMMATRVIHYSDIFKVYYLKRRKGGLPYKIEVLATAQKLIRVIYAMLTQRTTLLLGGEFMIVDCKENIP